MTEKQGPTSYEGNDMDMKELLQRVSSGEDLELEAILAEYGGKKKEDGFAQLRSEPDAETCEPAPAAAETEDLDSISPEEMFGMEGIGKAELLPEELPPEGRSPVNGPPKIRHSTRISTATRIPVRAPEVIRTFPGPRRVVRLCGFLCFFRFFGAI